MMIIPIIISVLGASGIIWGYFSEKASWNNGICTETGEPWVYFDTDSQGGRGYKSGDYCTTWISYPGIDHNYNHFERTYLDERNNQSFNNRQRRS